MDIEKCKSCIGYKDSQNMHNTPYEDCYMIDNKGHGENSCYIELRKDEPECCGKCSLRKEAYTDSYCEGARFFDTDDRYITYPYIRKNYLRKGKPKFCPYRNRKDK